MRIDLNPAAKAIVPRAKPKRVLIEFRHGLGDAIQMTVVLKHIRKYRPEWLVDIASLRGKHSAFHGLCNASYILDEPDSRPESEYELKYDLGWFENYCGYVDRPNTKITNCLLEVFGIEYDPSLSGYSVVISDAARDSAALYLEKIGCKKSNGKYGAVVLHYEGNTSPDKKNLTRETALMICEEAIAAGLIPVVLDWDDRSKVPDNKRIFNPDKNEDLWGKTGTGDAEAITALISLSSLFVGIDSGPGKCASATDTPSVICWTKHHPLQFHDPSPSTIHIVPHDHTTMAPLSGNDARASYFEQNYNFATYEPAKISTAILAAMQLYIPKREPDCSGLVKMAGVWVRTENIEQDLVIVYDLDNNDCYRLNLYDVGLWESVVDVGAHIGVFATLIHRRNPQCRIVCVEACPENIPALTANVGSFATVIHAAMTYEPGELALLNSVRPGCESTGGSVVVTRESLLDPGHPSRQPGYRYWNDVRPLRKITLRDAMEAGGLESVTCLKLDCEGSEISILGKSPDLETVKFVFGEWHNINDWTSLREAKFQGWDYGVMHDDAHMRGVFHLINPNFKAPPGSWAIRKLQSLPPGARTAQAIIEAIGKAYPETVPLMLELESMLYEKHSGVADADVAMHRALIPIVKAACASIQHPSIIETGVRAGYSSLAFFEAVPGASVVGYDYYCDHDSATMREAMEHNLAGKDFNLIHVDTNRVQSYPACDFFFVDGDHTFAGCYHDLVMATRSSSVVAIDDFYPDKPEHPVTKAVRWFAINCEPGWTLTHVPVTERCIAVLSKKPLPEYGAPWGGMLKIACVAGLGDTAWVVTKIPALLARLGAQGIHFFTCQSDRSNLYLQKLKWTASVQSVDYRIVEDRITTETGAYNYAPSQPGWHDIFDIFLQANGILENGIRLENWLTPDLDIDWTAPLAFEEIPADTTLALSVAEKGRYVVFFAGPLDGNTTSGHNVGGRWTPSDWTNLARRIVRQGYRVLLCGLGQGDRDYADTLLFSAGLFGEGVENCIDRYPLPTTLAILKRSSAHVGYQSGLGVMSVYMAIPTVMFWQEYGIPLNEHGITFSEHMAKAWVPPNILDADMYYGAIYGRDNVSTIADWLAARLKD